MAEQEKERQAAAGEAVEAGGSLLDEIVQTTSVRPSDETYAVAKRGLEAFIKELVRPEQRGARVHQSLVNELIADGRVFEGATGEAPPGRKPNFLYLDARRPSVVAANTVATTLPRPSTTGPPEFPERTSPRSAVMRRCTGPRP